MTKSQIFYLLIKLLDEEELVKCIEIYKGVKPECSSSHEYKSASTLDCIVPIPVGHIDDG